MITFSTFHLKGSENSDLKFMICMSFQLRYLLTGNQRRFLKKSLKSFYLDFWPILDLRANVVRCRD